MRALIQGSESERAKVLAEQGVNYAHCIDGLIRTVVFLRTTAALSLS